MFAKLEEGRLIICSRNGYVGKTAISNMDIFFENNPDVAKSEGWFPVVFLEEPADDVKYIIKDNVIYEVVNGAENS